MKIQEIPAEKKTLNNENLGEGVVGLGENGERIKQKVLNK